MASKTSLFSKGLFKKDLKLIGWLGLIATVILFFDVSMSNMRYLSAVDNAVRNINPQYYNYQMILEDMKYIILETLGRNTTLQAVVMLAIPISAACVLIGEERRTKTFHLLSVMPYTRLQIFFNKVLAGLAVVVTPYIANLIIMSIMRTLLPRVQEAYTYGDIGRWMLFSIIPGILFFSFSMLIGMIAGTTIAQIILTVIFMVFPFGFWGLVVVNLRQIPFLRSVVSIWEIESFVFVTRLTLPIYTRPERFIHGLTNSELYRIMGILLVVSAAMLGIAKFLFERNGMEKNGEILIFSDIETFFKAGVSFCTMLLAGPLVSYMMNERFSGLIIGYGIGLLVGWFIPHYFIQIKRINA